MVVYTVVTAAFYILGAAVLHARGEVPEGSEMVDTLADMYTESLGRWARGVFLLGAFVVLYSTVFSALAAWTRTFADAAGIFGLIDFADPVVAPASHQGLGLVLPAGLGRGFSRSHRRTGEHGHLRRRGDRRHPAGRRRGGHRTSAIAARPPS